MTIPPVRLTLTILEGRFCVCRLPADAGIPAWVPRTGWASITRTAAELSIACAEDAVPRNVPAERPYRLLGIEGPLDFALTGIVLSVARPLADAGIAIFVVSTFDTDYLLVRAEALPAAIAALQAAGHVCRRSSSAVDGPGEA
jgi:hypothetical protein